MSDEEKRFVSVLEASAAGWPLKVKLWLAVIVLLAIGALVAWAAWPAHPVKEDVSAAPMVKQIDGSVEVARVPDAHPPAPPHIIPKGFHEERRESLTVAPSPAAAASGCPPVRVALSMVRNGVERRVIASSPDGQVVDAIDMPIEAVQVPPPDKPWAAGLSYGTNRSIGLWVDRDIGSRLRVGAAIQRLQDGKAEAQIRVGLRW